MKATVIKFFDADGNEVKNVSTEIELNGELYVKKEKPSEYGYLVGKWVKFISPYYKGAKFTLNKWYKCVENIETHEYPFLNNEAENDSFHGDLNKHFDISNPLPYNPDTVVGLKELPNDGKTYAECLEDVIVLGDLHCIKGLFYIYNSSSRNIVNTEKGWHYTLELNGFTSHFRIHTPTPEPIWKTCREGMWYYGNSIYIDGWDAKSESLRKLTKHLNALAYLSEVARRCNGDRVVGWDSELQYKYFTYRVGSELRKDWTCRVYKEITFLDEEACDHSFEVDKHIWNDYFGLPNE